MWENKNGCVFFSKNAVFPDIDKFVTSEKRSSLNVEIISKPTLCSDHFMEPCASQNPDHKPSIRQPFIVALSLSNLGSSRWSLWSGQY